jgi:protein transport protein SEC20
MHAGSGSGKIEEAGEPSKGVPVDGLPGDDLPTIQVDTGKEAEILEEVDKIVNVIRDADGLGNIPEGEENNVPNPKKRMWEEPEVVEQERARDEL